MNYTNLSLYERDDEPNEDTPRKVSLLVLLMALELWCVSCLVQFSVLLAVDPHGVSSWVELGVTERVSYAINTAALHLLMTAMVGYFCSAGNRIRCLLLDVHQGAPPRLIANSSAFYASLVLSCVVFVAQLVNTVCSFVPRLHSDVLDEVVGFAVSTVTVATSICFLIVGDYLRHLWQTSAPYIDDAQSADLRRSIRSMMIICFTQAGITIAVGTLYLAFYGVGWWKEPNFTMLVASSARVPQVLVTSGVIFSIRPKW
jgi:hypothetical protein